MIALRDARTRRLTAAASIAALVAGTTMVLAAPAPARPETDGSWAQAKTRSSSPQRAAIAKQVEARAASSSKAAQSSAAQSVQQSVDSEANSDNPLKGRKWGVFKDGMDAAWAPYARSTGARRAALAKIALRPKPVWFSSRIELSRIRKLVRNYIDNSQAGDPNALVQMAIFAIKPWNKEACRHLPTMAQRTYYKSWINKVAAEIGKAPVLLIIQPDAPFALCSPKPSVPLGMMKYAVDRFAQQPNTTVYIEAGAADWLKDDPATALRILIRGGVKNARGFAFNSTHYDSTGRQIRFGAAVVAALNARGIRGKHFVINTSSNGRPFKGYKYKGPSFDNARLCKSKADKLCVTLGIPPTADVANPRWGLSPGNAALAKKYVDAYLWIGRPWLYNQASPFSMTRALSVVRTTPYG